MKWYVSAFDFNSSHQPRNFEMFSCSCLEESLKLWVHPFVGQFRGSSVKFEISVETVELVNFL